MGDARDAVALSNQCGSAGGEQDAGGRRDHRNGRAVRALDEVDLANGLAGLHLRAEIDQVFVNPRFRREALVLAIQRLHPARGF